LSGRRPRTVLGCLVACRVPVRPAGLGAGRRPGVSWGGGFPWVRSRRPGWSWSAPGLAGPRPPGRPGSLSRGAWPGGRARVARSPALPRGARSSSGDAPAGAVASARLPTGRSSLNFRTFPQLRWVGRPRGRSWGVRKVPIARPRQPCCQPDCLRNRTYGAQQPVQLLLVADLRHQPRRALSPCAATLTWCDIPTLQLGLHSSEKRCRQGR
jgi:hypothetical protein